MSPRSTRSRPERPIIDNKTRARAFALFTALFPIFFFVLAEGILRAIPYGPDISLFAKEMINGVGYLVINPDVKARYFSRVAFSPNTSTDYFRATKEPGTFRIFCLGGSTTAGFPYGFPGSFSSFLRNRLDHMFPDRKIEIINLGMTATNSFTVLDMARELPAYDPDLILVYDGHNEFYGALGVASQESFFGSRWMTLAYLRLIHSKVVMMMRDLMVLAGEISSGVPREEQRGTMMERLARDQYIPYGGPVYRETREVFRQNLDDLAELCRSHGIPLIVSTQVSNLRGLPPFVSAFSPSLGPATVQEIRNLMARGDSLWNTDGPNAALTAFTHVLALDSLYAIAHYRAARCLDSLDRTDAARQEYVRARDDDELRFRMSTDFNNLVRGKGDGANVVCADIDRLFRDNSPDAIIGNEYIVEHLHPNLRGYFLMAREYARMLRARQMIAPEPAWATRDTIPEERMWNDRPVTAFDSMLAARRVLLLTSEWPFVQIPKPVPPIPADDQLGSIVEQVTLGSMSWEEGHVAAARYFERVHDLDGAIREAQALAGALPLSVSAHLLLGQMLVKHHDNARALDAFATSLQLEQTAFAHRAIGGILADSGNLDAATPHLEEAFRRSATSHERADNGFLLGLTYAKSGRMADARRQLELVIRENPDFEPAREALKALR